MSRIDTNRVRPETSGIEGAPKQAGESGVSTALPAVAPMARDALAIRQTTPSAQPMLSLTAADPPTGMVRPTVATVLNHRLGALAAAQRADGLWQSPYVAAPIHGAYASIAANLIGDRKSGAAAKDKQRLLSLVSGQSSDGSFAAYPGGPPSRANTRMVVLAIQTALAHNPVITRDPALRDRLVQADSRARAFVRSQAPSSETVLNAMIAETAWRTVAPHDALADASQDPANGRPDLGDRLMGRAFRSSAFYSAIEAEALLHDPTFRPVLNTLSQPIRVALPASAVLNDGATPPSWLRRGLEAVTSTGKDRKACLETLKQDILAAQDGNGGWLYMGAMTAANLLALQKLGVPADDPVMQQGLAFLDGLQRPDGKGGVQTSFSEGIIWDSAMAGTALLRSGVRGDDPRIAKAIAALLPEQHEGRWSFATDSQHGMENDTTNVTMTFLALAYPTASPAQKPAMQAAMHRAADALLDAQQKDGGWNAWLPTGWRFGRRVPGGMEAAALDASTADVTGRVMTALTAVSRSGAVDAAMQRRIAAAKTSATGYLRSSQTDAGWWSRWMVGYVTTGGWTVPALRLNGTSPTDPMLVRQRAFLLAHQNADGGFGESAAADVDRSRAGQGRSTPAQTAMALVTLIATSPVDDIRHDPAIQKAVAYLLHPAPGDDQVAVYTANPGVEYYQSDWQLEETALRLYQDACDLGVAKALDRYVGPAR